MRPRWPFFARCAHLRHVNIPRWRRTRNDAVSDTR